MTRSLRTIALFAGIGGLELGLEEHGHKTLLMSEWDPAAQAVLQQRFPKVDLVGDIREIGALPAYDLLTGGFPCQDLSLAGSRQGLGGAKSGMLWEMFRIVDRSLPELILFENVSHLLRLGKGIHMEALLVALEERGYRWAYRLVDTRGFGLPQRRLRVVILASRGDTNPVNVLFSRQVEADFDDSITEPSLDSLYGFYWTEGKRGVGWAKDAVPTIKGGSGLGIPSPPAVYSPRERFAGKISIRDAERLQGFPPDWTNLPSDSFPVKLGDRWKMVGNAVSVPVSSWIGSGLGKDLSMAPELDTSNFLGSPMPRAAFGDSNVRRQVHISTHVLQARHVPLGDFLRDDLDPLSPRALNGYLSRVRSGTKRLPPQFVKDLDDQLAAAA